MEPNLGAREDDLAFDDLFNKFSQDIDEFQETSCMQHTSEAANHEDFTNTFFTFIDSRGKNNANDPSQQSIINLIQQDFEEFERAELPPCQADNASEEQREETLEMIDEMRQETWEFSITNDNNMCAAQSYSNFCGRGYGSCDLAYPSFGSGCVVRYFFCGKTKNATENKPRKRIKRKYRGVKLSEEEAARKMEENKIKNRESAAKAQHMKQAREAHLHSMFLKLLQRNERLKKRIMFLEFHERINIPPKPLKRTISALV